MIPAAAWIEFQQLARLGELVVLPVSSELLGFLRFSLELGSD
jgi:hypothetical protein